mgnify:CR=1 FL=1
MMPRSRRSALTPSLVHASMRTTVSLRFTPETIATAVIYLTFRTQKMTVKKFADPNKPPATSSSREPPRAWFEVNSALCLWCRN